MLRLIKIEFRKMIGYRVFWWLFSLYFVLLGAVLYSLQAWLDFLKSQTNKMAEMMLSMFKVYSFPDVWQNLTFCAGFFMPILAVIVILSVSNEYEFKTLRQNVITGLRPIEWLFSKFTLIFGLALMSVVTLFLVSATAGALALPESAVFFENLWPKSWMVLLYGFQVIFYLSFALMITLLVRKSILAIGLLLMYNFIGEIALRVYFSDGGSRFLPLSSNNKFILNPIEKYLGRDVELMVFSWELFIIPICWLVIFGFISYLAISKRDL
ncbi:MAG: ABC-2 type transport system permease protein [Sphingobacteriales bacterium]|jgi:ABC-2 type transport system permease protein